MTREEAIDILKDWDGYFIGHSSDDVNDALGMAIKALSQEHCEDCISRAELKKWLDMNFSFGGAARKFELFDRLDKELPPVTPQPKTGHWIEIAQYSDGKHKIECSECKGHIFSRGHASSFKVKNEYKFCPHCGKRMIDPQESENKE